MATQDPNKAAGTNAQNAETNADAAQQQPGGTKPAADATKAKDPDATNSVGGSNPQQPQAAGGTATGPSTGTSTGTDMQGHASREAASARENGEPPANATVGVTNGPGVPGKPPTEGVGYSPKPHPDTGEADSDDVGLTQAVQRLVPEDNKHRMAQALGTIGNIPSGSRPLMIDPGTGQGVQPEQDGQPQQGAEDRELNR